MPRRWRWLICNSRGKKKTTGRRHTRVNFRKLTGDRDEAMQQTRRLQADIVAERDKVKALMA